MIVGSLLGDHIKGRLRGEFPASIEEGIRLHRSIDAWTDQHPLVLQSHRRFDPPFRRFAPLMTDIIFDYFLANHWSRFHDRPLVAFHDEIFGVLNGHDRYLPEPAQHWSRQMQRSLAILRYSQPEFIQRSFNHLSNRLSRANPLADAYAEFEAHRESLEHDFLEFFPLALEFVDQWKANR
ncbi:MAG: DUF479 domain-containing protein [Pseudomonadales bacterium]|nr:DUF479 domain-containing protein [Pseudomonadales bacterium]